MKTIQNKQFILFIIFLQILTSNICAQSVPVSTAKKYKIYKVVNKLYWYNDTINPASINFEYYNTKGQIDSILILNCKINSLTSFNYFSYNKNKKLIKNKHIIHYHNYTMIYISTKSDIKKQKKGYRYDDKGRLIEIVKCPTSYLMKYTLTYDSLNNLVSESKYHRKDSTEERTISEYNAKNQLYKSTLILYKDGIKQGVLNTTFNFYNKNGLLEKSYNYDPGLDTPTSINWYEYTFY